MRLWTCDFEPFGLPIRLEVDHRLIAWRRLRGLEGSATFNQQDGGLQLPPAGTTEVGGRRRFRPQAAFAQVDLSLCRLEQVLDRLHRDRFAEVITLHFVAIVFAQKRHLIIGLDPLGDDPQIELLP